MGSDINTITVVGRLTAPPQLRYMPQSGTAIAEFSIANNYYVANKTNADQGVNFFEVTAFNKNAENICNYLTKGSKIGVTGVLRQERWTDRNTGTARSKNKILLSTFSMLDTKKDGEQGATTTTSNYSNNTQSNTVANTVPPQNQQPPSYDSYSGGFDDEDDVPF